MASLEWEVEKKAVTTRAQSASAASAGFSLQRRQGLARPARTAGVQGSRAAGSTSTKKYHGLARLYFGVKKRWKCCSPKKNLKKPGWRRSISANHGTVAARKQTMPSGLSSRRKEARQAGRTSQSAANHSAGSTSATSPLLRKASAAASQAAGAAQ